MNFVKDFGKNLNISTTILCIVVAILVGFTIFQGIQLHGVRSDMDRMKSGLSGYVNLCTYDICKKKVSGEEWKRAFCRPEGEDNKIMCTVKLGNIYPIKVPIENIPDINSMEGCVESVCLFDMLVRPVMR